MLRLSRLQFLVLVHWAWRQEVVSLRRQTTFWEQAHAVILIAIPQFHRHSIIFKRPIQNIMWQTRASLTIKNTLIILPIISCRQQRLLNQRIRAPIADMLATEHTIWQQHEARSTLTWDCWACNIQPWPIMSCYIIRIPNKKFLILFGCWYTLVSTVCRPFRALLQNGFFFRIRRSHLQCYVKYSWKVFYIMHDNLPLISKWRSFLLLVSCFEGGHNNVSIHWHVILAKASMLHLQQLELVIHITSHFRSLKCNSALCRWSKWWAHCWWGYKLLDSILRIMACIQYQGRGLFW